MRSLFASFPRIKPDGSVADDFRVRAALPTLRHILRDGPKRVVLATHFGRPKGPDAHHSTARFAPILASLLSSKDEGEQDEEEQKETTTPPKNVHFVARGLEASEEDVSVGGKGAVYLLENTRFHAYETKPAAAAGDGKDGGFKCPFNVDVFCNEAFSASHRRHTSVTGIDAPVKCVGFQLLREVMCLDRILGRAGEVSVAIVGGSKVSDKLPMLKSLSRRVDCIAIGGNNVNAIAADPSLLDGVRGGRAEILLLDDGVSCVSVTGGATFTFLHVHHPTTTHRNNE